jgi:hypothetical protein
MLVMHVKNFREHTNGTNNKLCVGTGGREDVGLEDMPVGSRAHCLY